MDVDGYNGGCRQDGTVQRGDKVEEHQLTCCQGSLEEESKNSLTRENMKLGCGRNCNSSDPTISSPDVTVKLIEEVNGSEISDTHTTNNRKRNSLCLATLPPELILAIFSYLDARFAMSVLTGVCKLFHYLLSPESSWKTRFGKRWPQRDKREDYDYVTSWKRICVQHEDMDKFWQDPVASLDFYELKDQHFATVDTVHVMRGGDLCISGARDRFVGVWNLNALCVPDEVGYGKKSFKQVLDGHKGWVWCLSSDPTGAPRVCSGSWDSKIKLWDLQGQNVEMTTISTHKAAVLCLSWEHDMLISGSYDKSISLWDLRAGTIINKLKNHNKPVLCLSVDDRFIISGSDDKTLCVYDKRAAQVYKTVKLESPVFSLCHSSTCGYNYLRVGGREGRLHLLDTTADRFEEITPSIELDSRGKISAMCHYGGAVVACSSDKSIKVLEPSRVLSVIHSFDCHSGQVASVSSRGPVLASCFSELSIGIWRPKNLRPAERI